MLIKTARRRLQPPRLQRDHARSACTQDRRELLKLMATGAAGAALAAWAGREALAQTCSARASWPRCRGAKSAVAGAVTMEKVTDYKDATTYNNFYEFGTDKADPAKNAHTLKTTPWTVEVEGLVKKPGKYALEDLLKLSAQEERIYRLRCVEGWSMVIPWVGYSLAEADQEGRAAGQRQVRRVHHAGRSQDHALRRLPRARLALCRRPAHGRGDASADAAGLRHVRRGAAQPERRAGAPGGAVEVRLQERQEHRQDPLHRQGAAAPPGTRRRRNEYGFYSNVNPNVDHPRWSQATERRIGEDGLFAKKRKTLMFNGYEAQVGQLYAGMDLKKNF